MIFNYKKPIEYDNRSISLILKDLYSFYLNEKDQKTIYLIERYWKVLPYKILRKYNSFQVKGKKQGDNILKDLVYANNPLLKLLLKDTSKGVLLPVLTRIK